MFTRGSVIFCHSVNQVIKDSDVFLNQRSSSYMPKVRKHERTKSPRTCLKHWRPSDKQRGFFILSIYCVSVLYNLYQAPERPVFAEALSLSIISSTLRTRFSFNRGLITPNEYRLIMAENKVTFPTFISQIL